MADAIHNNRFDITHGPIGFSDIKLLLDNDRSEMHTSNEDARIITAAYLGCHYVDQHVSAGDETEMADGYWVILRSSLVPFRSRVIKTKLLLWIIISVLNLIT